MSAPTTPAKMVPAATPTSQPFWDGTQAGELRLQHCTDCAHHFLYPRLSCPKCGSRSLTWVRSAGRGRLYSYVISHMAAPGWQGETPYVIAVVQLDEGPRMLSNLVDVPADPAALELDMPLQVSFQARGDKMLPLFKPAGGAQ
ncbi:MAG: Zn-ribbon domain-containing OB-fold protein [Burkholderiaceae bacterium]